MVRVVCFIRPHRLEPVKSAIAALGITGLTVSDVRGTGNSRQEASRQARWDPVISMPIKARIETVVSEELKEPVIQAILENAQTGESDDGFIFTEPIFDAVRIRTGERGELAA
jgi:nitrogen regulatory protein P-II 1